MDYSLKEKEFFSYIIQDDSKFTQKFSYNANSSDTLCIALVAITRRDITSSRRSRFSDFRKVSGAVWPFPRCIIAET